MSLLCDCPRCGGADKWATCENGIDIALDKERRRFKRDLIIIGAVFIPAILLLLEICYG